MKLPPVKRLKISPIGTPTMVDLSRNSYHYVYSVQLDRGDPFRLVDTRVIVSIEGRYALEMPQSAAVVATYVRYRITDVEFDTEQGLLLQVPPDDHAFLLAVDPERAASALDNWIPVDPVRAAD